MSENIPVSSSEAAEAQKLSISDFLKTVRWILGIYFKNWPVRTSTYLICDLLMSSRQLVYAFLFGNIIDRLIQLSTNPGSQVSDLYSFLGILLAYYIITSSVISSIYSYAGRSLRRLSSTTMERIFYEHLNYLGIQNLEDPDFSNVVQRSSDWLTDTFQILMETTNFISNVVKLIAATLTVIGFFPILIPALIVFTALKFIPARHFDKLDFRWQVDNTKHSRKARKSAGFLQSTNSLHEISVIGAYKFFDEKFKSYYEWYLKGLFSIMRKRNWMDAFLGSLDSLVSVIAYGLVFRNVILGIFTVGQAAFQMRAIDILTESITRILGSANWISEFSLKMQDLVKLFDAKPAIADGSISLPTLSKPPEIELKNVSFKYPKSAKYIFRNLNLKIKSGEKIAIVGHNGAGKTTLIKLLSRFYAVTEGSILINGININDLKIADYYKNLGVLFQDFNFYPQLSAGENITVGETLSPPDENRMIEAAKNADAHEFISEYKNGYDQVMSEQYEGGIRPSSGQMQKIAIARFFYRNAPLVIFDEPTASIDAVSEYKIFNRIYEFFDNKTVIIISHRFSTVRNADRIIVLDHGQIVEEGSHSRLLNHNGIYAHAFKLQAEGYGSKEES